MTDVIDLLVTNATLTQSVLFGATIILCWVAEKSILDNNPARKNLRARINALFALTALPLQIAMAVLFMALAAWVTDHRWGLLFLLPGSDDPWIKYGLMFVVLDFLDYVYHRAMHHIPCLWRFHLVHHTDQAIDASTTVREHPGETVVRNGFLMLWIATCGASVEILVLRQAVESVANILAHTSFRLSRHPANILGWLLITPNLHHVHHHSAQPYTDSNYGDVFSIWDRLFGTFANLAVEDIEFGLDSHINPLADDTYLRALAMPFDRSQQSPTRPQEA